MKIGTPAGELPEPHWDYVDKMAKLAFGAMYFDYPEEMVAQVGAQNILQAIRRQIARDNNATLANLKPLSQSGNEGSEFTLQSEESTGIMRVHLWQVNNRLYRFTVRGNGNLDTPRVDEFFASFGSSP